MESDLLAEANRQVTAANGIPIDWYFAEQAAADHMSPLLPPEINVHVVPPEEDGGVVSPMPPC
jgi:hypothetical protein